MCCCLISDPINDSTGRIKTFSSENEFQTSMMNAPCQNFSTCIWFCGQFIPLTCGCTQYFLRRKVLNDDLSKYSCFQGYFNFCCVKAESCGEARCPHICLFMESCCCNCIAISASRSYVMEKYDLNSDPCDYRLIRVNNCLQLFACVCNILGFFISELRHLTSLIDRIADIFYHCVSGCMTAQVSFEMDHKNLLKSYDEEKSPEK